MAGTFGNENRGKVSLTVPVLDRGEHPARSVTHLPAILREKRADNATKIVGPCNLAWKKGRFPDKDRCRGSARAGGWGGFGWGRDRWGGRSGLFGLGRG